MMDLFDVRFKAVTDYRLRKTTDKDTVVSEYVDMYMRIMTESEKCSSFNDFVQRLAWLVLKTQKSLPKSPAMLAALDDASAIAESMKKRFHL